MKTVTDVLNKGLEITWGEIRTAKNLIQSRGYEDAMTRAQCQRAFSYISFLHKLGFISIKECESMAEHVVNEINKSRKQEG